MSNLLRIYVQHSVIKGYHHFKFYPPKDVSLQLDSEYSNVHYVTAAFI